MKILHINKNWGCMGGAEQYLVSICEELEARGYKNTICYEDYTPIENVKLPDLKAYQIRGIWRYSQNDLKWREKLDKALEKETPDIVFLHGIANSKMIEFLARYYKVVRMVHDYQFVCLSGLKVYRISKRICSGVVGIRCWLHGCLIGRSKSNWLIPEIYSIKKKKLEIEANKNIQKLLVASSYMKRVLLENGFDESKIIVLPLFASFVEKNRDKMEAENKTILFVGQIEWAKGIKVLLKTMTRLNADINLQIIGDGSYLRKAKRICNNLEIGDRVRFLGWIDNKELGNYYTKSSIVVVSSIWPEPFGLVGIEAMAYGRPVIAFNVGGVGEWLRDSETGYLVDQIDERKLAERIEYLLQHKKLIEKMGKKGQRVVNDRFNKSKYIDELVMIFKEMISEKHDPCCGELDF